MSLESVHCLNRANQLIDAETPEALRYAALELRYCIEAICYDKLHLYKKQIPQSVIETWQPRKLVDALEQFDPQVNQPVEVVMFPERPNGSRGQGVWLGRQAVIGPVILKKHYNKLGSLLHVPILSDERQQPTRRELVDYLRSVAQELHEAAMNRFQTTVAQTVSCACSCCESWIVRNLESISEDMRVDCPSCGARYTLEPHENAHLWRLDEVAWDCPKCHSKNYTPRHGIRDGIELVCHACQSLFAVQQQFVLLAPSEEGA